MGAICFVCSKNIFCIVPAHFRSFSRTFCHFLTEQHPFHGSVTACCTNQVQIVQINKVVYYESIKREPKIRGINKCRCDERLQTKTKEFTRLPYTGLVLELEHLKIETRLISVMFVSAMGECEN